MEVLVKSYWLFLDTLLYVTLYSLFILVIIGIFLKTMIDKFFYSFFGALDNIWNFFTASKDDSKKRRKGEKDDR
jgi:hypothetical protein